MLSGVNGGGVGSSGFRGLALNGSRSMWLLMARSENKLGHGKAGRLVVDTKCDEVKPPKRLYGGWKLKETSRPPCETRIVYRNGNHVVEKRFV